MPSLIRPCGHGSALIKYTGGAPRRARDGPPARVLAPNVSSAASLSYVGGSQSFTARSRSALPITLTEDSAMASAAKAGDSSRPKAG